jgi:hypothetical protein
MDPEVERELVALATSSPWMEEQILDPEISTSSSSSSYERSFPGRSFRSLFVLGTSSIEAIFDLVTLVARGSTCHSRCFVGIKWVTAKALRTAF